MWRACRPKKWRAGWIVPRQPCGRTSPTRAPSFAGIWKRGSHDASESVHSGSLRRPGPRLVHPPAYGASPGSLPRVPRRGTGVTHGDGDRLLLADQHNQPLAACHSGVEQVPLEHGVVLCQDGDDDRGILRALAFVNFRSVSWHQRVELAEHACNGASVETCGELAGVWVDIVDVADVAVVD